MNLNSVKFAHDLKLPVQLIYSCAQMLELEIAPGSRAGQYLRMLVESADQIRNMVMGALDAPAADEVHFSVRDVAAMAREKCLRCMPAAQQRGISLCFETNAAQFRMRTDGGKLERILDNLLLNALRFTPAQGRICLAVLVRGDSVDFEVRDSGCGIAPGQLERIFEPGVTDGGHGWGLAIAREYAGMLGGSIRAESEYGRGSRFTLHLPVPPAFEE